MPDSNEMLETLKDVVMRLDELGVDHMITGSFAMSLYATARMTMDIDVVIDLSSVDAKEFEAKFLDDYYVDAKAIRSAEQRRSMFNIISNQTGVKVDCIVKKREPFEVEKFGRRVKKRIGGIELWAITKEDLVLSKLKWASKSHSELQFRDIRNLIESGADLHFISAGVDRLDLNNTWSAFEEWKIRAER